MRNESDGISLTLDDLLAVSVSSGRIAAKLSDGWRMGVHYSRKKGRGMEFAEVRPYMVGDDVRNMDWRITARTGKPHTKLFREERDRSVYILIDLSQGMYFGSQGQLKARMAALIAAAVAWYSLRNGDKIGGLITAGDTIKIHSPTSHRKGVLVWLQEILEIYHHGLNHPPEISTLETSLHRLGNMIKPGSRLVILSDFYHVSEKAFLFIRHLRKKHDLNLIQIFDMMERKLEGDGTLAVDHDQGTGFLVNDDEFRSNYARIASYRQYELERKLGHQRRQILAFDAAKSLAEQL